MSLIGQHCHRHQNLVRNYYLVAARGAVRKTANTKMLHFSAQAYAFVAENVISEILTNLIGCLYKRFCYDEHCT